MNALKQFGKWLVIAFVVQAIFVGITWPIKPIGEILVYIFYAAPYALVLSAVGAPKTDVSIVSLIAVPMIVWSALISVFVSVVLLLARNNAGR
jgi:hypothetical protein